MGDVTSCKNKIICVPLVIWNIVKATYYNLIDIQITEYDYWMFIINWVSVRILHYLNIKS